MKSLRTAILVLAVWATGCQTPPVPPEVRNAEAQERDLWRAGASIFASQDHEGYVRALAEARRNLEKENLKLGWFRDYGPAEREFRAVLQTGESLLDRVEAFKASRASALSASAGEIRKKISTLGDITLSLTERGKARQNLARAEVHLLEAEVLAGQGRFEEASAKHGLADRCVQEAETAVVSYIGRYLDPRQVTAWKRLANETIAESKKKGLTVLIVSKLERRLAVYRSGLLTRTYPIGLGFNGLADKRHSGDNATPEGRYRIIQKIPSSQYYKALLINYPNEEDIQRFALEKKTGSIPRSVAIGGDIEIHGGGRDSLTRGCVSLDNDKMDDLYALVSIGTPVTIIGTMEMENYVIKAIKEK